MRADPKRFGELPPVLAGGPRDKSGRTPRSDTFSKVEVITGVARRRRFPTDLKEVRTNRRFRTNQVGDETHHRMRPCSRCLFQIRETRLLKRFDLFAPRLGPRARQCCSVALSPDSRPWVRLAVMSCFGRGCEVWWLRRYQTGPGIF